VWCWGDNTYGQTGDGTTNGDQGTSARLSPVQVVGLSDPSTAHVVALAGADDHHCALKTDGSVWCWGWNIAGEIGDGASSYNYQSVRTTPVQVVGLSSAVSISCGYEVSCALKADGTVWCWGDNGLGELGTGGPTSPTTPLTSSTPLQVTGLWGAVAISAGADSFSFAPNGTVYVAPHGGATCAIRVDGALLCWGFNLHCQGIGGACFPGITTPGTVQNLSNVLDVATGYDFTMALRADGTVWWWGSALEWSAADPAAAAPVQMTSLFP
jgi:alpha-tubulin suppressor-like RCC1 family protein